MQARNIKRLTGSRDLKLNTDVVNMDKTNMESFAGTTENKVPTACLAQVLGGLHDLRETLCML